MSWNESDENRKTTSKPGGAGFDINGDPTGGNDEENLAVLGRIDQYELLKELGTGGFGSVYFARDTVSRIFVAVKGLPALVKNNAEEMERIQENFALVSRLHHPNIAAALVLHPANAVSYSDQTAAEKLNVKPGNTLMVMEYAPGVTLTKWRRQFSGRKVPLDKAIEITRQIAVAMDYAHQRQIIHRDIKPSNVMVETSKDGTFTVRVLDFGLAAEVRSSMNRVSNDVKSKTGTRQYMAPEQWSGKKQGAATDQYSLAVLFYELVTGEIPFASAFECDDPIVMMTAVTTQEPEIPDDLPKKVQQALKRGLNKERDQRFATCSDFVAALEGKKVANPREPRSRAVAWPVLAAALALVALGGWWWHANNQTAPVAQPAAPVQHIPPSSVVTPAPTVPVIPVVSRPIPTPAPAPVDEEAERRRLDLAAELPAYALASQMDTAAQLIAREPEDVRAAFGAEIRAFESLRKAGEDAKAHGSYVAATNLFSQAKAKADALKRLIKVHNDRLVEKKRADEAAELEKKLAGCSEEVRRLYARAMKGAADAQYNLGTAYDNGRGVVEDDVEAVRWYRKAAEQGYAAAQTNLGYMYAHGEGVEEDKAEAVRWYRKAAAQGYAAAQYNLGTAYDNGRGVEENDAEAVRWYRKAAEQGYADAQHNLGYMYSHGEGVEENKAEAVRWYRKASEQGDPDAQYNLGVMYDKGRGVEENDAEAARWYRKAAEQGKVEAQYNLGVMYDNGSGVEKNVYEAARWYEKAAEQGDADAQFNLGWDYAHGEGVRQDDEEAVKWFKKAARQGYEKAQNELNRRNITW